ncbi:KpsF/GutQ family sugar-phosphate isomerase [Cesiribacter andamanensis]|uniref:Arabinose 5-phosphate isomerase KdsD n=1 Tax=Cesiribacter andamanensis AMV16 TaxID=1279009 RepID=M7N6R4_9BACT|nr:KpsF/GutQ family sugar-phosphate isomerase [Cesiribacter andamanensis]EMR04278.1 Arabinose 5-phosphate isomerase KdsD [Cesiribacter andamanensis AMV16]
MLKAKNLTQIAQKVLQQEAAALQRVSAGIDSSFEACVEAILSLSGRVVVTGIGKSAIVANKIVATLNSTGTPALFMHAADAIHGDLGMVQKDDLVICISKSGNTPEIKVLVPLLKRTGALLTALVSNTDSYLARQADFILNGTIDQEACPNNLAPTTSTTVHMALGDALAVCLVEARGFTSQDFARLHPGGSLGKQLYLKVGDIYKDNELPVVFEDDNLKDTILEISGKRLGAAAVLSSNQELIGIITDGDLRRMLQRFDDLRGLTAADVMSPRPKTVCPTDYAAKALQLMQENNISQLVVVSEDERQEVLGFVHIHNLIKEGII